MIQPENSSSSSPYPRRLWCIGLLFSVFIIILSAYTPEQDIEKGSYILKYPAYFGNRINTDPKNPITKEAVYLGRRLFYESRLSANNTMNCGSCHMQAKAFTDGRKLSIGVDDSLSERNSMSLVNLLWTRKFFWDGRSASLEEQASVPMVNPHEMGQSLPVSARKLQQTAYYPRLFKIVYGDEKITGERIVLALAQFERTLISAGSRYDLYLSQRATLTEQEMAGLKLFNTAADPEKGIRGGSCAHCHGGPKNYLELFHNNGLDLNSTDRGMQVFSGRATDRGRFKVPTLRNIALTAPYMHDGRFSSLEEVLNHYSDHLQQSEALSAFLQHESNEKNGTSLQLRLKEKEAIIAFLHTLTDSTFVKNPEFSNPFTLPGNAAGITKL